MALKYELEQWGAAVKYYDDQDFERSLETFETIADSAKFHFNIGLIYATLGEHEEACRSYQKSVKLDEYFAVAYFQKGVSHFLLSEFQKALNNFNDALLYLRGNMLIDYEQLGLKFRLYSCEVLFNRGLCYLYLGETDKGLDDFSSAAKEKQTEEHDVIDEAIAVQGQNFTVFSIPVGVIYRPPEGKLKNVKTKDYLGKAKLVAAVDPSDAFVGFTGAQQQKKAQLNTTTPISKSKTDGKVDQMDGSNLRPESPTEKPARPRSLSSNPKAPPFPITRNPSISYKIDMNTSDRNNDTLPLPTRNPSTRRPPQLRLQQQQQLQPQRSNTIDNGRPSPKFSPPTRLNSMRDSNRPSLSMRDGPSRSNSVRGIPRMNSLRGRGIGRPVPQRQNTQVRTEIVRQQMSKINLSDDGNGNYPEYYQDFEQYNTGNDEYSQLSPGASPARSPSLRGRGANSPIKNSSPMPGFKSSPLAVPNGMISPQSENGEEPYSNLIFDDDDNNFVYGADDDDTQFEMLPPPQKNLSRFVSNEPLITPTKIKIKCHHKDTRVVMVAANISFPELSKRIQEKFSSDSPFNLYYKDEEGSKVRMTDQEDLDISISMVPKSTSEIGRMELFLE